MAESFETFFERRRAAASAYVAGDAGPVLALSAGSGQATFFDPGGGVTEGAEAVNAANARGAASFGPGGTSHLEVRDQGESGDLAFWTGLQVADVEMEGRRVPMRLRVTEVFRRQEGEWRMVHRHASPAKDGT